MTLGVSKRPLSSLIALSILLLVCAVIYAVLFVPVQAAFDQRNSEIQQSLELLDRFRGRNLDTGMLERRRDLLKREVQASSNLLRGANPAVAAATLQQFIRSSVQAERGTLRSVQTMPEKQQDSFRRITVRSQVDVNAAGLRNILHRIESSRPFLFIDNIDLRPGRSVTSAGSEETEVLLTVRFDVYGFVRAADEASN